MFDRARVSRNRARAAKAPAAFLRDRAAEELLDRVRDVNRSFARALELGGGGAFARALARANDVDDKIGWRASSDVSFGAISSAPNPSVAIDEERLAVADAVLDLVVSPLSLHWTNDLPGALIQIRRALKPDGLFLGAMLGGATLTELRGALVDAEVEIKGGAAARVSPVADLADASGLLQRAGFALPVADSDTVVVRYADPVALMQDIRAMGESAAFAEPAPPLRRDVLERALTLYNERHADSDGRVPATFEILYLTGWAPDASQPKPLRPGSATTRLADALGVEENPAGEKAGPRG